MLFFDETLLASLITRNCMAGLLMIIVVGYASQLFAISDDLRDTLKKKAAELDQELKLHQTELASWKHKENSILSTLDQIDKKIDDCKRHIARAQSELDASRLNIKTTGHALDDVSARKKTLEAFAGKRLVAWYKMEKTGVASLLFSAETFQDWLRREYYLKRIVTNDIQLLSQLDASEKKWVSLQETRKKQYLEQKQLQTDYAEQIHNMEIEKKKRDSFLKDIQHQKKKEIAAIEGVKEAMSALDHTMHALNSEDTTPDIVPPPHSQSPAASNTFSGFVSSKGLLQWPVKGKIASSFGREFHTRLNVETFHNGVDIQSKRGESVRAVYAGNIVFSDWYNGYGNMIIISHGDRYYTIYAHLDERLRSKGDHVSTGEIIGTAGDTDSLQGTGVYFEVRHRGKPMDPQEWIKKG